MKKSILPIAALIFSSYIMPATAQSDCGDITISEMNWASGQLVTSVSKFLLEQGYGCNVQTIPTSTVPSVVSLAETGKPDIITELWITAVPLYKELEEQGKVITATQVLSDGGSNAWWIPKYLVDKHPVLKTIEGVLANPELVGGRFHNAPNGWGMRTTNDNLIKAFDFAGNKMDVFNHGSGETLAASIASAYNAQEPWFGYYWAPTSVLGKYDMVAVDMGAYDEAAYTCAESKECANPQKTSLPSASVVTAITTDLATREPEVLALMKKLSFTNKQMSQLLAWQEANKASSEEAAVHFITTRQDIWSAWLSEDARKNLAPLMK